MQDRNFLSTMPSKTKSVDPRADMMPTNESPNVTVPAATGFTNEEFANRLHLQELPNMKALRCFSNSLNHIVSSSQRVEICHVVNPPDLCKALGPKKIQKGMKRAFNQHQTISAALKEGLEDSIDYGYGQEEDLLSETKDQQPETKRRRMQRRNSKTPAMLVAMNAAVVAAEYLKEERRGVSGWRQTIRRQTLYSCPLQRVSSMKGINTSPCGGECSCCSRLRLAGEGEPGTSG